MLYINALHNSFHQNHRRAPSLQTYNSTRNFFVCVFVNRVRHNQVNQNEIYKILPRWTLCNTHKHISYWFTETNVCSRAVWVVLQPLFCWDCGFKSRRGAWKSVSCECGVCCQVEVSTSGRSLVQRSPVECGVSECDHESSKMSRLRSTGGCCVLLHKCLLLYREGVFTSVHLRTK